jgi:hypothetical protein
MSTGNAETPPGYWGRFVFAKGVCANALLMGGKVFEMKGDGFLNVQIKIFDGLGLGEDVLAHAARTPKLAVVVDLHLCQHE